VKKILFYNKSILFQKSTIFVSLNFLKMYIYKNIITIESGKRSGKPCIRGMRITVEDILRWFAAGMNIEEIIDDFPDLTRQDILVALEFSAEQNRRTFYHGQEA
jgi:uncharacterized protein (DUF433 family)